MTKPLNTQLSQQDEPAPRSGSRTRTWLVALLGFGAADLLVLNLWAVPNLFAPAGTTTDMRAAQSGEQQAPPEAQSPQPTAAVALPAEPAAPEAAQAEAAAAEAERAAAADPVPGNARGRAEARADGVRGDLQRPEADVHADGNPERARAEANSIGTDNAERPQVAARADGIRQSPDRTRAEARGEGEPARAEAHADGDPERARAEANGVRSARAEARADGELERARTAVNGVRADKPEVELTRVAAAPQPAQRQPADPLNAPPPEPETPAGLSAEAYAPADTSASTAFAIRAAQRAVQFALADRAAASGGGPFAALSDQDRPLTQIYFSLGNFMLGPNGKLVLERMLPQLTGDDRPILIVGSADPSGSEQINEKLSDARAQSVAEWMLVHGVDAGRIQTRAIGHEGAVGSTLDRRVDIWLGGSR